MDNLFDADKPHFATWLWIYNGDKWGGHPMSTVRPEVPEAIPLYYAAKLGFCDLAERLIVEHPEHVNARGGRGGYEIPMHAAAREGMVEVWQCLLDRGANINARDCHRHTTLMWAVVRGHVEFARMLLEREAVIDAQDEFGMTALHYAGDSRDPRAVQLLLEHGADVEVRDRAGDTPSKLASSCGYQEIVELLSAHGAESVKK
jgi:ankyrin repeat protein